MKSKCYSKLSRFILKNSFRKTPLKSSQPVTNLYALRAKQTYGQTDKNFKNGRNLSKMRSLISFTNE